MIIKRKTQEPEPQVGDFKITRHFAWWPKTIRNEVIWLERYKQIWEYTERRRPLWLAGPYHTPVEIICGDWDLREVKRGK